MNALNNEVLATLFDEVPAKTVDIMSMTVGEVASCIISNESLVNYIDKHNDWLITEKIAFFKGFCKSAEQVFSYFKKFENDVDAEYGRAVGEVGEDISMAESMLLDCVDYYHLHSTSEAEKLPFSDWFMMKRREVVKNAVERRYNKIMVEKQRKESKR
jgi:hypothetical protein